MASVPLITLQDVVVHLLEVSGGLDDSRALNIAKRAVFSAYRKICSDHRWSYLTRIHRLTTDAPYETGTIAYDHTGGTYERMVTLTGGTWPDWAARGVIYIDSVRYDVATKESPTVITLESSTNPGEDVASGATYSLVRDVYTLPIDFVAGGQFIDSDSGDFADFQEPETMVGELFTRETSNIPRSYTVIGDPDYVGVMAARFYPPPSTEKNYGYVYTRKPLPLRVYVYQEGTVSVTSGTTAITSSGATFNSGMIGSVLRLGDTTNTPTPDGGSYPFVEERVVSAVPSSSTITLDSAVGNTYSAVKYTISSLIDVEEGTMLQLLYVAAEMEYARMQRDMETFNVLQGVYLQSLVAAKSSDRRYTDDGVTGYYPEKLSDIAIIGD